MAGQGAKLFSSLYQPGLPDGSPARSRGYRARRSLP